MPMQSLFGKFLGLGKVDARHQRCQHTVKAHEKGRDFLACLYHGCMRDRRIFASEANDPARNRLAGKEESSRD